MFYTSVDLYEAFGINGGPSAGGKLAVYAPEPNPELLPKRRPAALVLAGGGYGMLSHREGEPIVFRLLAEGFAVFRLEYSLNAAYPAPLVEAAMAVAYIRLHAEAWGADGQKVCVFGFSAGGHLAAMLATMFGDEAVRAALQKNAALARPDAAVLSYPVVTTEAPYTHEGTAEIISGKNAALRARLSVEKAVKADSVPAFLWHTAEDGVVPVESSLRLAAAYRAAGVPFELHVFERGVHGLALADGETSDGAGTPFYEKNAQAWFALALAWLKLRGFAVR